MRTSMRCAWCGDDPVYVAYHDEEWGVPQHDDGKLFEMLILEGAQAGLSWSTILKKREGYRRAFHGFNPNRVAQMTDSDCASLLFDTGIVRNRLKIASTVSNAQAFLSVQQDYGSFDAFLWKYVDGSPIQNSFTSLSEIPAETVLSKQISKDLKRLGFRFVGPTIIYAFMQATGMVNDHISSCFRASQLR